MKKNFTLFSMLLLVHFPITAQLIDLSSLETDSVLDIDGNVYPTVLIGETWWMGTNLRTKHYNNGSEIMQYSELISDFYDYWSGAGQWAYPDMDSENFNTYGLLYSWPAVINEAKGGACPHGWSLTDTADWFNLARIIVGDKYLIGEGGTRNTPQGGTETYYEISYIEKIGRFIKSDNGDSWGYEPTISVDCNGAKLNVVPSGKINSVVSGFGTLADFWTGCYVHSDSSGQGRRYLHFDNTSHTMYVSWNHHANLQCARCVKAAHLLSLSGSNISLDSTINSTATIAVTANYGWTAQSSAAWLNIEQDTTFGNGFITITTTSENTEHEPRTDTVFVLMDDAKTKTILVTQAGKTPLFGVSADSLNIMSLKGSTATFSISSTVDWTISSSDTWLTSDVVTGIGNTLVTLTASENTKSEIRSALVTVESKTADTLFEIVVTQAEKMVSAISVAKVPDVNVLLFPNPVGNELCIVSESELQEVSVISLTGKTILNSRENIIRMENIPSGIYIVKISTSEGIAVKKIMKN